MTETIARIEIGSSDGGLYLAIDGEATRHVCPTVNRLVSDYLVAKSTSATVILNLQNAAWVDSTFAGWMLRVWKELGRMAGGAIVISGCSKRCRESLDTMRLTTLIEERPVPPPGTTMQIPCGTCLQPNREVLELMAQAHEELATVSAENRRLFSPMAAMLRAEIAKQQ